MITHKLSELIYSSDLTGPFRLYVIHADGFHRGPEHFPAPEFNSREAMRRTLNAIAGGLEVRITNACDELVLHWARDVQYPPDVSRFFIDIGAIAEVLPQ